MSTPRGYQSARRREQALETQRRIRQSARRLFETRGFTETTVAQIAAEAGVAPQTIYAIFENKAGLVGAMLEELEESVDMGSWEVRIRSASTPREQLRLFVAFNRAMFEAGAPILRAIGFAQGSREVAEIGERGDRARREGTRELAHALHEQGALHAGLDPEGAAGQLWLLTSAEQYLNAVDSLGWSPAQYESWLSDLLQRQLMGDSHTT